MSEGWTTIPPWLYENDLPDDQLQEVYVREARTKAAELAEQQRRLDEERQVVASQLEAALAFVAEAEERLQHYRARVGRAMVTETVAEAQDAVLAPRRKRLPDP